LRQLRNAARVAERDITRFCDADFIGKDRHRTARGGRRRWRAQDGHRLVR
jgi:hypothetical protein